MAESGDANRTTDPAGAEAQRVAATVTRLADEYVSAFVARFPDRAALNGLSVERHDLLPDNSLAAMEAWHAREDGWADALASMEAPLRAGDPGWTTHGFLQEAIESSARARICRFELWPVNQLSGWQADLVQLADVQPVGTRAAREAAIARWSGLPHYLETEIENLCEGLRLGYSTPQHPVQLVISQLDALLDTPIEQWPLYSPATRDGAAAFHQRWRRLLVERIGPAVERYRNYLRDEYVAKAREGIGMSAHPDGEAGYHAAFRACTTIERSGAETFELGMRRVEQNLTEALEIGRTRLGTPDLPSLVAQTHGDRANRFESRDAMLEFVEAAVARSAAAMGVSFSRQPQHDLRLEPYPAHLERDALDDSYWPAAEDGRRPARYLIALYHFAAATRSSVEITAFHEAYPGHHLQISRAHDAGAHPIERLVLNDGFVEGWARYAEALADDLGLYTSEYARASRRLWPARGMVVDPGIHLFGWSRDRAAAFMAESGRMTVDEADQTVDRISVWPGQFAAYDTGGLEFFALRARAEAALGTRFDIRAYHDVVLGGGAVTLPMLRERVERWLDSEA